MDVTFQMWVGRELLGASRGRAFTAEIWFTSTVKRMKDTVMEQEGIPVEHQRLFFGGVELEDGVGREEEDKYTTELYSVLHGSTVDLLLPYHFRAAAAGR